eukprot:Hpha_TRINITY_DN15585_c1_g11::TRINITY_DN15585_c1_g11_i1::g.103896::m.103896
MVAQRRWGDIPGRDEVGYTAKYSEAQLTEWRKHGDVFADRVVAHLHKTKGLTNIFDLLSTVQKHAEDTADPSSQIYRDFLSHTEAVPPWVDWNEIEQGQRVFARYTSFMYISLLAGSLVGGANFTEAARVTVSAGNIASNPVRRINETGALISQLALVGTLRSRGEAHTALRRIRLLHAGLRHFLVSTGRYTRTDEVPINQHDLAVTLAVFAYQNLRSLERMNVHLSEADKQAYMALWRYAGFVLGIEEELLPESALDQEAFFFASLKHQGHPELIPEKATKDFLDAFAKQFSAGTRGIMPMSIPQSFLYQWTVYLNGADWCEGMKIKDGGSWHWTILLTRAMGLLFGTVVPSLPFGSTALERINLVGIRQNIRMKGNKNAGRGMMKGSSAPKATNEGFVRPQPSSKL